MFAFGCPITSPGDYDLYARPGIELAAEPDSEVLAFDSAGSITRNYNLMLEHFARLPDLEAVVLVHQDAEIADPDFCAKARAALADPDVAVVGSAGAIGVRSIAWWEGAVTWAAFTHRYDADGSEIPGFTWDPEEIPSYAHTGEVGSIDGFAMVLSPWAVESLRFDESLGTLHGYDFDYCMQARQAHKKIVVADLRVIHHHSLTLVDNLESWVEAHMKVADKWEGRFREDERPGCDWKQRARRAEADAAAMRLRSRAGEMLHNEDVERLHREIAGLTTSISWRLTRPVRAVGRGLRRLRGRERPQAESG